MMQEKILITNGEVLSYCVRKSFRAKRVSVTLGYDGAISVTLPHRTPVTAAEHFLKEKARWVIRTRARAVERIVIAPESTPAFYRQHKRRAKRLIGERVAHFNQSYGFAFSRISIRNQKTRWGSCSSKKNLQFNYRLIFLPPHLLDYVVVHELCHLTVTNHGARFYASMTKTIPEHKAYERQLRRYRIG